MRAKGASGDFLGPSGTRRTRDRGSGDHSLVTEISKRGFTLTEFISQAELIKRWGASRQTAAEWARRPGCPKRTRNGKPEYQWPEFLEWWASERERAARDGKSETLKKAELRLANARARLAEMEVEVAEGTYVSVEDAVRILDGKLKGLRSGLLAFPQRLAPTLVGCKTMPELTAKLDTAIRELMTVLSGSTADQMPRTNHRQPKEKLPC